MKPVQEPVHDRRYEHTNGHEEDDPREQRVDRREEFPPVSLQVRDRPHAPEDHRRIERRIKPAHVFQQMVSCDADPERHTDDSDGEAQVTDHASGERDS